MTIELDMPEIRELKPKITVFGIGGAGGNAVNNMIRSGLVGCEFVVANTDSQALASSEAQRLIQMGAAVTEGLGAGSQPEVGQAAAEEAIDEINDHLNGSHMVFITAGMGGGTGTGAAPIIARTARDQGILTVGVVTKPFQFEGARRMRVAEAGIQELQEAVDTLIVIPNQNLFRVANEKTTFADAFAMADQVLYSGVACITDLMVKEGLINLDFADVRSIMREMGKAMMGTGEASGDRRSTQAAEAAIANPLLDETSMKGAGGLLISITGGKDMTLFEVDEAATRIREEVDVDANIILGATFDESLEGVIRVSVVATGIDSDAVTVSNDEPGSADITERLRTAAAKQPAETSQAAAALQAKKPAPAARKQAPTGTQPGAAQPVNKPQPARPAQPAPAATTARPAAAAARQPSAAAPAHESDITIEPFQPGPIHHGPTELDLAPAQTQADLEHAHQLEAPFVPPAAETPAPRVPRVQDFPPIAQQQIAANREKLESAPDAQPDRGPLGLLKRLATVGLGRRDEQPLGAKKPALAPTQPTAAPDAEPVLHQPAAAAQPVVDISRQQPPLTAPQRPTPATTRTPAGRHQADGQPVQNQGAPYRPPQGDLDQHGRAVPRQSRPLDDELEIPAFLRRQAN